MLLFPLLCDELLQRPDASPELRRVCLYVLLGDDKLNIVGLHFFELLLARRLLSPIATPWWRRGRMAMKLLGPGGE